jgi:two-component system alkaline phosphatase synthesis response regulator PhoP
MLHDVGYEVVATPDGVAVYDLVLQTKPDLVVLDIVFKNQDINGFEICDSIRLNDPDIPIILITGVMTGTDDILLGFDKGSDDYVTRPRDNREIIARIRANLPPEVLLIDDYLCIDLKGEQVYVKRAGRWQKVHLTRLVFELLKVLVMNAGLVMLTTVLKGKIWEDKIPSDDVLAVYIHRLREKIEPDPAHPKYIENLKGFGYRFNGKPVHISRSSFMKLIE